MTDLSAVPPVTASVMVVDHPLVQHKVTLVRSEDTTTDNFRRLVRDARYELAKHYLLDPSLDLAETAYLLGYEDPNSFFRAFREWEGTTPNERRAAQRGRSVQNEQSRLARPIRQHSA